MLDCFKFHPKELFEPVSLEDPSLAFKLLSMTFPIPMISRYKENALRIESLFMESLSVNNKAVLPIEAGCRQYCIADLVNRGYIFPNLENKEREIEEIKWLWASYQSAACTLKIIYVLCFKCLHLEEVNVDYATISTLFKKKNVIPLRNKVMNQPQEFKLQSKF